jgi:hypothetical protein
VMPHASGNSMVAWYGLPVRSAVPLAHSSSATPIKPPTRVNRPKPPSAMLDLPKPKSLRDLQSKAVKLTECTILGSTRQYKTVQAQAAFCHAGLA